MSASKLRAIDVAMTVEQLGPRGNGTVVATAVGTRYDGTWRRWPIARIDVRPGFQAAADWLHNRGGNPQEFALHLRDTSSALVMVEEGDFLGGEPFARAIWASPAIRTWRPKFGMVQLTGIDLAAPVIRGGGRVNVPRRAVLSALADGLALRRLRIDKSEKELQDQLARQRTKVDAEERDGALVRVLALSVWGATLRLRRAAAEQPEQRTA